MRQIDLDEWEHDISTKQYPQIETVKRGISDDYSLPDLVRTIYRETVAAINADHLILASIGLRSTIEAVCNDRKIQGRDLHARIGKLRTTGTLGKTDTDRLHSIRFLGNDAAHEIASPLAQNVQLALEIVEHLLRSLYLFDSHGSLERPFRDYTDMKATLQKRAGELAAGTYSLSAWLGRDARRLGDDKLLLEQQLLDEVKAKKFANVAFHGPIPVTVGSKRNVNGYTVTTPPP